MKPSGFEQRQIPISCVFAWEFITSPQKPARKKADLPWFCGIILSTMAKLREQARLIRAIQDFPDAEGPLEGLDFEKFMERNFDASQGMVSDDKLMKYCAHAKIFNSDKQKDLKKLSDEEKLSRKHKLNLLRKSCEDRKFIEPIKEEVSIDDWDNFDGLRFKKKTVEKTKGWTITDRGSDLLNRWGFLSIAFEKHIKITSFLWGALSGIAGACFLWIVTHLSQIIEWVSRS
jgi:hypothetical protein